MSLQGRVGSRLSNARPGRALLCSCRIRPAHNRHSIDTARSSSSSGVGWSASAADGAGPGRHTPGSVTSRRRRHCPYRPGAASLGPHREGENPAPRAGLQRPQQSAARRPGPRCRLPRGRPIAAGGHHHLCDRQGPQSSVEPRGAASVSTSSRRTSSSRVMANRTPSRLPYASTLRSCD